MPTGKPKNLADLFTQTLMDFLNVPERQITAPGASLAHIGLKKADRSDFILALEEGLYENGFIPFSTLTQVDLILLDQAKTVAEAYLLLRKELAAVLPENWMPADAFAPLPA